jgi:PhnB protein
MNVEPELYVSRSREAVEFYRAAFGATEIYRFGGEEIVAQLSLGDSRFWVAHGDSSPEALGGTTVRLLLVVDDPHVVVERAVSLGATASAAVHEEHGWLVGRIEDPYGHRWEIGKPLGEWPPA